MRVAEIVQHTATALELASLSIDFEKGFYVGSTHKPERRNC
jgi:hypothetical protein